MKLNRAVFLALTSSLAGASLAACGDDATSTPDAATTQDGAVDSATLDAAIGVDAPIGQDATVSADAGVDAASTEDAEVDAAVAMDAALDATSAADADAAVTMDAEVDAAIAMDSDIDGGAPLDAALDARGPLFEADAAIEDVCLPTCEFGEPLCEGLFRRADFWDPNVAWALYDCIATTCEGVDFEDQYQIRTQCANDAFALGSPDEDADSYCRSLTTCVEATPAFPLSLDTCKRAFGAAGPGALEFMSANFGDPTDCVDVALIVDYLLAVPVPEPEEP